MDGIFVCAALTSHYVIFNVATGTCQDLFPYEPETHPIITRISKVRVLFNCFIIPGLIRRGQLDNYVFQSSLNFV